MPETIAPTKKNRFRAIGIMSGTSLDGLDLCLCEFTSSNRGWDYSITKSTTIFYSETLQYSLENAMNSSAKEIMLLNSSFGKWIGEQVNNFLQDINIPIDVIGSHGHTIFHNPSMGYTTQIGSGAHIAAITGIPCVCDFRNGDIARGGQGAPLVPIGDELLFANYDYCINIGGITNISYKTSNKRIAFDICPANMALNHFSSQIGFPYDKDGLLGQSGNVDNNLLEKLEQLEYYNQTAPKSLGREWFESDFLPIISEINIDPKCILRTLYEHISNQICKQLNHNNKKTALLTGGGAKNGFLISLIKQKSNVSVIVPHEELIDYKEALIFALLAVLYLQNKPSCLSTVTGAHTDSVGGSLYY